MYQIIKTLYQTGKLTAKQVWDYADSGKITVRQAAEICGARP